MWTVDDIVVINNAQDINASDFVELLSDFFHTNAFVILVHC